MTPDHFVLTYEHIIIDINATVWLYPNHRLLSFDVIEEGDMIVCGYENEIDRGMMGYEMPFDYEDFLVVNYQNNNWSCFKNVLADLWHVRFQNFQNLLWVTFLD